MADLRYLYTNKICVSRESEELQMNKPMFLAEDVLAKIILDAGVQTNALTNILMRHQMKGISNRNLQRRSFLTFQQD